MDVKIDTGEESARVCGHGGSIYARKPGTAEQKAPGRQCKSFTNPDD